MVFGHHYPDGKRPDVSNVSLIDKKKKSRMPSADVVIQLGKMVVLH